MKLSEIYDKGQKELGEKNFGFLLDGVETGFVLRLSSPSLSGHG